MRRNFRHHTWIPVLATLFAPWLLFAQVDLTPIYTFSGSDGSDPTSIVQGSDGNLYGVTNGGGTGNGSVFKMTLSGQLLWEYNFSGGADGAIPNQITEGRDGNFYGVAVLGGLTDCVVLSVDPFRYAGCGTIFKVTPDGQFSVLYTLTNGSDGAWPAAVIQGSDGNLYATATINGRLPNGSFGSGTVFQLTLSGTVTSVYTFAGGSDGSAPYALVQGSDGNFYGMTQFAGNSTCECGTIFKVTPTGIFTLLYSFTSNNSSVDSHEATMLSRQNEAGLHVPVYPLIGSDDGTGRHGMRRLITLPRRGGGHNQPPPCQLVTAVSLPNALVEGPDGYLYGSIVSPAGIEYCPSPLVPFIFKISLSGDQFTTLYMFTGGSDGAGAELGLTLGSDGNFYGETQYGGNLNDCGGLGCGTIFSVTPSRGSFRTLYTFTDGSDGAAPFNLIQGTNGYFYGAAQSGGTGQGTIFKLVLLNF